MGDGILVVGSINMDMVVSAPRIPGPGENVCGAEFHMVPGGKGANQAVAAQRLGNRTVILGRVGDDIFGDSLLEKLTASGVDTTLVTRASGRSTGVALIVVEEGSGVNTIVVSPGANMELRADDLDTLEPYYEGTASVVFQLEIPFEVVAEGARRAREKGVRTVLDAGPPRGLTPAGLEHFDVVSPNRDELGDLTGMKVSDLKTTIEAGRLLVDVGVPTVVVKMGEDGSLLVSREGSWHCGAYRVESIDATAAGDAFTAGLATAVGEGMEWPEALRFANASGALAVTVLGAQPSMPDRSGVEELMGAQEVECVSV